jgi:hypothetical protein
MSTNKLTGVGNPTAAQDAATKSYVDTKDALKLNLTGGTMSGTIAMGSNKVTGVTDPTNAQDASTKAYTDAQRDTRLATAGGTMTGNISIGTNKITTSADPVNADDLARKSYVDAIHGSAVAAATSATNSANSATASANSASAASTSETNAANSAASSAASYDLFDDRFLGAKSSAPTTDNDGGSLVIGTLYFDTTAQIMKVYGSSGWQSAGSAVNGTSERYKYTATNNQTTFSGADDNSNALGYDAGFLDVFLSGIRLVNGVDFTATSGTSIQLASGAATGDILEVVTYGTFVLSNQSLTDMTDVNTGGVSTNDLLAYDGTNFVPTSTPTLSGAIKTTDGLLHLDKASSKVRQYAISSSAGTQSFLLGRIRSSSSTDGGITGVVKAAYDQGDTLRNVNVHFTFAQRTGTAKGHWWYENTDDDSGSDVVSVKLIDDGSNNYYVWLHVGDYVNCFIDTVWRQVSGSHIQDSGSITASTITSGTTLFDTANDPTSEHHIGKLYAHDDVSVEGQVILRNNYNNVLKVVQDDTSLSNDTFALEIDSSAHTSNMTSAGMMKVSGYHGNAFEINGMGSTIINEAGAATADFRVGSNNNTHALFVDGGNGRVNVGGTSALGTLCVESTGGTTNLSLKADTDQFAGIFYNNGTSNKGALLYNNDTNTFTIRSNGVTSFEIAPTEIALNNSGNDLDFRVETNATSHGLLVDGGNDRVLTQTSGGFEAEFGGAFNYTGLTVRNTGSSISSSHKAQIDFEVNGTGGVVNRAQIIGGKTSSGSTTGYLRFDVLDAGTMETRLTLQPDAVVVNENSYDVDFRVESSSNANAFKVDAGDNNVLVGTGSRFCVGTTGHTTYPTAQVYAIHGSGGDVTLKLGGYGGSHTYTQFLYAGNNPVGSIVGTSTGIVYNTTSDRRLKKDIETITDGTDKLMAMNPVTHGWKADPEADEVHGFIAQEMMDIVPEAVSGDPEGEDMMSMDYGRITPVIVAALQEANKKIMELENRINELEGK